MNLRTNLSRQLKQRRTRKGLSQNRLAGLANVSSNTVQKIEAESTATTIDTLAALGEALGCQPWELLKPLRTIQQRCRASSEITEEGGPGDEAAEYGSPDFIHAKPGDEGMVLYVDAEGIATVRFDRTGTATIVYVEEIEFLDEEEGGTESE